MADVRRNVERNFVDSLLVVSLVKSSSFWAETRGKWAAEKSNAANSGVHTP